jgi:hypothetical protein
MTVVAAFEFDDFVTTRRTTCKTDRCHRGLGARAHETHLFERRHAFDQHFGDDDFGLGWRAIGQAVYGGILDGLDHFGMGMTKNCRTP